MDILLINKSDWCKLMQMNIPQLSSGWIILSTYLENQSTAELRYPNDLRRHGSSNNTLPGVMASHEIGVRAMGAGIWSWALRCTAA